MASGYIIGANKNSLLDSNGENWLDMQSGILNTPLGHDSRVIRRALTKVHATGLINTYDRQGDAAARLVEAMELYKHGYTWKLFNTGGEALDKAVQIVATIFGRAPTIAVLPESFHGKLLSLSWAHYGDSLPWGNPLNLIVVDPAIGTDRHFDALIYEPVQGHGGKVTREEEVRQLCWERGAILIADEMITGFLRCGKRFMSETADIVVTGKGISGGAPLSLLGFSKKLPLPQGQIPVGWRSTGVGNNLCATIGLAILEDLIDRQDAYLRSVGLIESRLTGLGFSATGALGFKRLKHFDAAKEVFERRRVIASWHNKPNLRVGPSFVTNESELGFLASVLEEAGEL